jgi:hypothetical protein
VDVARASDQIDALIEKRARQRAVANREEMTWKASVRQHNETLRRQHRNAWYCHFAGLASALRKSAEAYEAKAEQLLLEEGGGGA